ncbi:MAG: DUF1499 domain-containing protein [Gammaproteobacteria bacterium]|nr:DUF1499 domain-containing protein [Rhodoferax sp.]MBU3898520.1 DUF1499 domain-containing protein [Gammaproteobacteria bacterium]MBU3997847.1 DUF1499 domain-containing protein [Gammaproteobacteria bacterium]MBU4079295.1 DUF1499 domain-containing protein [Gammaproteobacteria bacterium]MBU4113243.1 DUF1499 domain-containing protein [Gammaproteobacteria bacterium]
MKWIVIVALALVVSAIVAGQMGLLHGKAPTDLGLQQGKLKGLSSTDNSVSSQADLYPDHPQRTYSSIAPLALPGDGPSTIAKLKGIVEGMDGAKLITNAPDYLYAQYTTALMKYVDDVEFWFDPTANVIQVRSASRLGKSDLGANRKRIEVVRAALAAAP